MKFWRRYKKIILVILGLIIIVLLALMIANPQTVTNLTTPREEGGGGFFGGGSLPTAEEGSGQLVDENGDAILTPLAEEIPDYLLRNPQEVIPSPVANGGITQIQKVVKENVAGVSLSNDGNGLRYYDAENGLFYRLDSNGNPVKLSDKVFYDVETVTWANNSDKAVLEYPDGSNIVYNFDSEEQVTLPQHWEDFEFSPSSDNLVMKSIGLDSDNRWLIISNDDGTQAKGLELIGDRADYVIPSWSPNNQTVAMYTRGKDLDRQEVFFVGQNDENFKSIVVNGYGFQGQWAPKGDKLLYSVYSNDNDLKPSLWIVNAQGDNIGTGRSDLEVETWAEKCTFADDRYIYCAVPDQLQEGAGLFPELAYSSQDNIYRIDTLTGAKKLVATPDQEINVSNIVINDSQTKLYFTDYASRGVYEINLR